MQFFKWLENRKIFEMKDSTRELLAKYASLVRDKLDELGIANEMGENQLIGYLNSVAGFSIPTEGAEMKFHAESLTKALLKKLVEETISDSIRRKFGDSSDLAQVINRDTMVKLLGNLDDLKAVIRVQNKTLDIDKEGIFSVKNIIDNHDNDYNQFIADLARDAKISGQSAR